MKESSQNQEELFHSFAGEASDPSEAEQKTLPSLSQQLLNKIFKTLNCPENHKATTQNKNPIHVQETHQTVILKCNCKKSKCLKLYCQCFARGSFCNGCNCECCHNTEQFIEIRAKAIDQVMVRASLPFGHKNSSVKGCNCKKTGCQKKYCECFGAGEKCHEYCKCSNCLNS